MKTNMDLALHAARCFGLEAGKGQQPSWSESDRSDIALHYGVAAWKDIPPGDQVKLLASFMLGERQERAKSFSESVFAEVARGWTIADWERNLPEKIMLKIKRFIDEEDVKQSLGVGEAASAFERWMGWR